MFSNRMIAVYIILNHNAFKIKQRRNTTVKNNKSIFERLKGIFISTSIVLAILAYTPTKAQDVSIFSTQAFYVEELEEIGFGL